ncbi:hypothetical protein [Paenibacillus tyrfis]|uniref:Uncharacterized protein n=1 Tax=Paenibacillus tyrfis TaxID=1501230 RepID=A0A081P0M4_9BACL|nr:hypothetical protein [Paenibacillus tyrfis]KEQ24247.1 hypothetical protein ET33_11195 [Paenibacillus tyrfis]
MKKKIILSSLVLCFALSTSAFAASKDTDTQKIKGFDFTGKLSTSNPVYSNAYAGASTTATLQCYEVKATVKVTNTDGTTNSRTATENNTFKAETGDQYANSYWTKGVHFDGSHEASDSKFGYYFGSTYNYY